MTASSAALLLDRFAVDVHCHLLPGADEGSRDVPESLVMARGLAAIGVRTVHVTPHQFRFGNEWTPPDVARRAADLEGEIRRAGIDLAVRPGAEHLYGERLLSSLLDGEPLVTFPDPAGSPDPCLLVELPLRDPVVGVERVGDLVRRKGWIPLMAHPERVVGVQSDPGRLATWRRHGWRYQLDLMSLVGTYGRAAQGTARRFLEEGVYEVTGSDLHRPVQLRDLERAHAELRRRAGGAAGARPGTEGAGREQ